MGNISWQAAVDYTVNNNLPTLHLTFSFPRSAARSLLGARVRGVAAYVEGIGDQTTVFSGTVAPPDQTVVVDEAGKLTTLTQGRVSADLSRVQSRKSVRPPDVVGISVLRNLSPFSPDKPMKEAQLWVLNIDRYSASGDDVTQATDVQLDLFLLGVR
jgi:hypothetical protein